MQKIKWTEYTHTHTHTHIYIIKKVVGFFSSFFFLKGGLVYAESWKKKRVGSFGDFERVYTIKKAQKATLK